MTKKQRFLAAVRREVPDVVPVAPLIHNRYANKVLGRTGWQAVFDVHRMIGSIYHRGPLGAGMRSDLPDGYGVERHEVERHTDGRTVDEWTIRTPHRTMTGRAVGGAIPEDPLVGKVVDYPVKCREDWLAFLDYRRQWLANIQPPDLSDVRSACDAMGEDGMPSVGMNCAYASLANVRGMEGMMMDCHDLPDLMDELFEVERQIMEKNVEAAIAAPTELAWLDICWATGSNLGPEWFERWALPDVVRAMEKLRGVPGKYLGLYTLGRTRELLPMLVDTGVHFIETFEPNEGDITLGEAKKLYGDKTCLMGNFNCLVLARGTVDDARKEALRCLREGMEGGGFVLVTADEVPADTKMDNLKAMVETVEEQGTYA